MNSKKIIITNPIVTVDWLQEKLNATNLVILNGTIPRVVDADKPKETQQIPNARFFDIKNVFSQPNAPFPNTMINLPEFILKSQDLGINEDSAIVVYDELGIYSSARVWYMFTSIGFDNIAVLDGGFPAWKAKKYNCEEKVLFQGKQGDFQAQYRTNLFRNYTQMLQEIQNKSSLILDARSSDRFTGKVPEPRKGLRSGQIPTSKNLPYAALLHNKQLKSKSEIKAIFEALQTDETELVFSCGSGITACILALAADYVGYKNYSVYDGSWTEWGSLYN
ncbi:sulfurtransferase [Kordia sp.]|uniref:sulfurtransferase n=1 Tax=Kordia sp. TaxID=1965332 RepID=UPI003D2AB3D2